MGYTVLSLRLGQHATPKGNNVYPIPSSPTCDSTALSIQNRQKDQNGCRCKAMLQFTESMLAVWRLLEAGSVLCELAQGPRQCGKVLNKTSIVVCHSHELLHLTSALWHWPGGNPLSFARVNCHPMLRHNVHGPNSSTSCSRVDTWLASTAVLPAPDSQERH